MDRQTADADVPRSPTDLGEVVSLVLQEVEHVRVNEYPEAGTVEVVANRATIETGSTSEAIGFVFTGGLKLHLKQDFSKPAITLWEKSESDLPDYLKSPPADKAAPRVVVLQLGGPLQSFRQKLRRFLRSWLRYKREQDTCSTTWSTTDNLLRTNFTTTLLRTTCLRRFRDVGLPFGVSGTVLHMKFRTGTMQVGPFGGDGGAHVKITCPGAVVPLLADIVNANSYINPMSNSEVHHATR